MNRCESCPYYWQDHDESWPSCHYDESASLYPIEPAPCEQDDEYREELPDEYPTELEPYYQDELTYSELLEQTIERGASEHWATSTIMRLMDDIEKHTGTWPDWSSPAPDWVREIMEG